MAVGSLQDNANHCDVSDVPVIVLNLLGNTTANVFLYICNGNKYQFMY